MDPKQARALLQETLAQLRHELRPELERLRKEVERQEKLVEALVLFVEDEEADEHEPVEETPESLPPIEPDLGPEDKLAEVPELVPPSVVRGKTADRIRYVLEQAGEPMGPSDVLEALRRLGIEPESQSPDSLIGTTLQRMQKRSETSRVKRVGTGKYLYFDPENDVDSLLGEIDETLQREHSAFGHGQGEEGS